MRFYLVPSGSLPLSESEYSDVNNTSKCNALFLSLESLTLIRYDGNLHNNFIHNFGDAINVELVNFSHPKNKQLNFAEHQG